MRSVLAAFLGSLIVGCSVETSSPRAPAAPQPDDDSGVAAPPEPIADAATLDSGTLSPDAQTIGVCTDVSSYAIGATCAPNSAGRSLCGTTWQNDWSYSCIDEGSPRRPSVAGCIDAGFGFEFGKKWTRVHCPVAVCVPHAFQDSKCDSAKPHAWACPGGASPPGSCEPNPAGWETDEATGPLFCCQ